MVLSCTIHISYSVSRIVYDYESFTQDQKRRGGEEEKRGDLPRSLSIVDTPLVDRLSTKGQIRCPGDK